MKIHCIGDSHACFFGGLEKIQPAFFESNFNSRQNKYPFFNSVRIGLFTAYQLDNKRSIIEPFLSNLNMHNDDKILFCFGEIDIRAHLIKQSKLSQRSIDDIVYECVTRYVNAVSYYKKFNRDIIMWGPSASWTDSKPYPVGPQAPSYGTNVERNNVTKIFNQYLQKLCEQNNFGYISIFEKMLNPDGTTNPYYIMDHIHISQTAMPMAIEEFKSKNYI